MTDSRDLVRGTPAFDPRSFQTRSRCWTLAPGAGLSRPRARDRNSKLTPAVQASIVAWLRQGASVGRAAAMAGISRASVFSWVKQGREGDPDYEDFAIAVSKARAEYAQEQLAKINDAQDWKAAAWLLERMYPSEFGRVPVDGSAPPAIHADLLNADPAALEASIVDELDGDES